MFQHKIQKKNLTFWFAQKETKPKRKRGRRDGQKEKRKSGK